jgi:putative phage-type endonuclease
MKPLQMIPANTPQWIRSRIGCLTASRMGDAMAFLKNGKESADRKKLRTELLAERLADVAADHFVTPAMQWGLEQEPRAKEEFEEFSGELLMPAGFVLHPTIEHFGATPDGILQCADDLLIEIKCPTTTTHIEWVHAGVVPEQHKPQMLAQLACTGYRACWFMSFDPRIQGPLRRFIRLYEPKAEEIEQVEEAAKKFLAEAETMFEQLAEA